jgi:hypothetical protein
MPTKLTDEILTAAIEGFEAQKKRIDARISEIKQQLSGDSSEPALAAETPKRRRRLSAAARLKIANAQRKRWAASRQQPAVASKAAPKKKRRLSAAGRKRIIEATKKRWAAVRAKKAAQAAARQSAPPKKAATAKAAKKGAAKQAETPKTEQAST